MSGLHGSASTSTSASRLTELEDLPPGCTLGLNYSGLHDSAVAIVGPDGRILFACALERLSRVKQDGRWPALILDRVPWSRIDRVAIPALPHADAVALGERFATGGWPLQIAGGRSRVTPNGPAWHARLSSLRKPLVWFDHHAAHAASAWFLSGLPRALVITCDAGASDCPWVGATFRAAGDSVELVGGIAHGAHRSPANLYTLVTALLGLRPNRHEGKVTGLSATGRAKPDSVRRFLELATPMLERMDQLLHWDLPPEDQSAPELIVNPVVRAEWRSRLPFRDADLAACVQTTVESMALRMLQRARELAGADLEHICLAGGFFANVLVNQRLLQAGFASGFVAPPMTDDGVALGAALLAHAEARPRASPRGRRPTMFLGPGIARDRCRTLLSSAGLRFTEPADLATDTADHLAAGRVVAIARGPMEFGPRALGHRSILSRASDPAINVTLNQALRRTEFMPFAPMTLAEDADRCYRSVPALRFAARFMTVTADCTQELRAGCPAVVHVDGTARPQLVSRDDEPFIHDVLAAFEKRTGIGTVLNTSFNIHEEPIVASEEDALIGFAQARLDVLVLGDAVVLAAGNESALEALLAGRTGPARTDAGAEERLARWLCHLHRELGHSRDGARREQSRHEAASELLAARIRGLEARVEELARHRSNALTVESIGAELGLGPDKDHWARELGALREDRDLARVHARRLEDNLAHLKGSKLIRLAKAFDRCAAYVLRQLRGMPKRILPARPGSAAADLAADAPGQARHDATSCAPATPGSRDNAPPSPFDTIDRILLSRSPKVTVVIPCFNHGQYLDDVFASLEAQTFPFFEVILVDDGSTDATTQRILDRIDRPKLNLRVLRQENQGPAAARNRGIAAGSAAYVLCLDADDTIEPTLLMQAVGLLDCHPELGIAYCDIRFFGDRNEVVAAPEYDLNALLKENFMVVTSLFRRTLWTEAGGFSPDLVHGYEDWALWIAFAAMGYYGKRIPSPLFNYRVVGESRNTVAISRNMQLIAWIRKAYARLYGNVRLQLLWAGRFRWHDLRPVAAPETLAAPLVSIVITCFNYGRYLGDAVRSALEQTWSNIEVIVIDDGSTDEETRRVLREHTWPRTRVFRQENSGLAAARNRGFELANGDYVVPLDADDILMPGMVEKCLQVLLSDSSVGWAYTDIRFFDREHGVHKQEDYNFYLELTNNHCTVCALVRKRTWTDAGGYMSNMAKGYEDWNFWVSCSAAGWHGRVVDGAYFGYRRHGVSMVTESVKHHQHLVNTIRSNHPELYLPWNVDAIRTEWMPRIGDRRCTPACEVPADPAPFRRNGTSPLFSVVVPVYRHHEYFRQCVDSILAQSCQDFEVILVDDCSRSAAIDQALSAYSTDPRVTVLVNQENLHVSHTLNRGVLASSGEYLAFVDCDDFLVPDALARVRTFLESGEAKYFVSTQTIDVDASGDEVRKRVRKETPRDLLRGNFAGHLKIVKRDVFQRVGLFDPELSGCQDYDLVLRAQEHFPIHFLQEYLYCYRWHANSVSVSRQTLQDQMAERVVRWTRYRRWLRDASIEKSFHEAVTIVVLPDHAVTELTDATRILESVALPVELLGRTGPDAWTRWTTRGASTPVAGPCTTLGDLRESITTPHVIFLPPSMTPDAGALETLLFLLTSKDAAAVSPLVRSRADGAILTPWIADRPSPDRSVVDDLSVQALAGVEPAVLPLCGTLVRTEVLRQLPADLSLADRMESIRLTRPAEPACRFLHAPHVTIFGAADAAGSRISTDLQPRPDRATRNASA